MRTLLILFPLLAAASLAYGQTPIPVQVDTPVKPVKPGSSDALPCNYAGTFNLGTFFGQSNDIDLDTIYLCFGDSIFIDHNGDGDVSNSPIPATLGGIAWAFYNCPPTVSGDNLQAILTDPCLTKNPPPTSSTGMYLASGTIEGDIMLQNLGQIQNFFNMGNAIMMHFAPITVDYWDSLRYESPNPPFPAGPCVNVNTDAKFAVAYLNPITAVRTNNQIPNSCIATINIDGGLPNFNPNATYQVDVFLAGNPSVKGLTMLPPALWKDNVNLPFTVEQEGLYTVVIEDGKSCGFTFQVDLSTCIPANNAVIAFPDTVSPPGSSICIPVTAGNFDDVFAANFNIGWDPAVLSYTGIQNPNPEIGAFNQGNLNTAFASQGLLSANIFNLFPFDVTNGGTLFEICFDVVGNLGDCLELYVPNAPGQLSVEDVNGALGITVNTGTFCVDFLPLTLNVALVDTTCSGLSSSATLAVTPKGGIPPYEVFWQELPAGATFSGVVATDGATYFSTPGAITTGTYRITLTDQNGQGVTLTETIVVNFPTLGASINVVNAPTCFGNCDGSIAAQITLDGSIIVNPNLAQYTFSWSGNGTVQGVPVQSNLCAGVYTVTVTQNASGCVAFSTITLSQPARLRDANIVVSPSLCTGLPDGSIAFTAQGGSPLPGGGYAFNWTYSPDGSDGPFQDEMGTGNPYLLSNKVSGFYSVTVTDANGCTFTRDNIFLGAQRTIALNAVETGVSCFGNADGILELSVNAAPTDPADLFSFFLDPPSGTQNCSGPYACTVSDLPPGTYIATAINQQGCIVTEELNIGSPTRLVLDTFTLSNPSCALQNNGTITVIAFGGVGSPLTYQYTWSDGASGPNRTQLVVGQYGVTVTDLNGCQDSLLFNMRLDDPPAITGIDSVSVRCGNDGCLTVNADPSAILFTWLDIFGNTIGNEATVCGIPGGFYVAIVSDNKGCQNVDTVRLGEIDPLRFADTTLFQPSCFGLTDGNIAVSMGGGTPPYSFLWTPTGQNNSTLIQVGSGTYTLDVVDFNGCRVSGSFLLPDPPPIVADYSFATPTNCYNSCDGRVTPIVQYADGRNANFEFIWSDGSTDSLRNNLCRGTVFVTIFDPANSCFRIDTLVVASPDSIGLASLTVTPTRCFGDSTGAITVVPNGGAGGPYQFAWSIPAISTPTVAMLPAGVYTVTVTDASGCTGAFSATVTQPPALVVTQDLVQSALPTCFGDANGQLAVNASGGSPGGYSYQWRRGNLNVGSNSPILPNIASGSYSVTVTDASGCTVSVPNLLLSDPPRINGSYLPWLELVCNGDQTTLFIDTITGGSGAPYQYSLDFGVLLDPSFPINLDSGQHFITYYDRLNCSITDTIFVVGPDPLVVAFNPSIIEIELGDTITALQPIISGALVESFVWTPANLLLNPTELRPTTFTFQSTTYTLTIFDANGCSGTGSIRVEVDPNRNVYFPNIFQPGNDSGLNDHFNIFVGLGVESVRFLKVFDRWGGMLYERTNFLPNSFDFGEGWDGRFRGQFVQPGVYVYLAEVKFRDGRILTYRGDVTVVR
jgi:hypothetical protein